MAIQIMKRIHVSQLRLTINETLKKIDKIGMNGTNGTL